MKFSVQVHYLGNGKFEAKTDSELTGPIEVTSEGRYSALSKIKDEILYRLEYCPCSGVDESSIEIVDINSKNGFIK